MRRSRRYRGKEESSAALTPSMRLILTEFLKLETWRSHCQREACDLGEEVAYEIHPEIHTEIRNRSIQIGGCPSILRSQRSIDCGRVNYRLVEAFCVEIEEDCSLPACLVEVVEHHR
jgi:hypothetical protein